MKWFLGRREEQRQWNGCIAVVTAAAFPAQKEQTGFSPCFVNVSGSRFSNWLFAPRGPFVHLVISLCLCAHAGQLCSVCPSCLSALIYAPLIFVNDIFSLSPDCSILCWLTICRCVLTSDCLPYDYVPAECQKVLFVFCHASRKDWFSH